MKLHHHNPKETVEHIYKHFDKYDWFYDAEIEVVGGNHKIVVYVDRMDSDVSKVVPDTWDGFEVKMAFTNYHTCGDKYGMVSSSAFGLNRVEFDFDE
jgi:hypothetical protein